MGRRHHTDLLLQVVLREKAVLRAAVLQSAREVHFDSRLTPGLVHSGLRLLERLCLRAPHTLTLYR